MRISLVLSLLLVAACGSEENGNPPGWMPMEEQDQGGADSDMGFEPDTNVDPPNPCEACENTTICVQNTCAPLCVLDDQCEAGLVCASTAGPKACVAPTGAPDGTACAGDGDCQGGTCITDWPDGYCTTLNCSTYEDCSRQGENNRCFQQQNAPNLCVRMCARNTDCRTGYVCERINSRQGLCAPDPRQPIDPSVLENNPFGIQCEDASSGEALINYMVAQDTTSYMITPFSPANRNIAVREITLPSGQVLNLNNGPNSFQSIPVQVFGTLNPTVIPAVPQFSANLESGAHTFRVLSEAPEICWYQLEKSEPGNAIDVNIYLVGVPGVTAASAPNDANFSEVTAEFDKLYRAAGIAVRTIRYYDVSAEAAQRFGIIRDEGTLPLLLQESARPGDSMEEVLSVNLFFVRGFNLGGAIGISLGLPGPAGLHGMGYSGVIFTSQYMGIQTRDGFGQTVDGNFFTAQVLAHEVGHYLGLFHTSESNGFNFDPLLDTPTCSRIAADCPDVTNLMFPFASALNVEISPDQTFVLKANPLTQFDPTIEFEEPDMGEDMDDMGTDDMGADDMGADDMGTDDMGDN